MKSLSKLDRSKFLEVWNAGYQFYSFLRAPLRRAATNFLIVIHALFSKDGVFAGI
jgi:hypothetical protein